MDQTLDNIPERGYIVSVDEEFKWLITSTLTSLSVTMTTSTSTIQWQNVMISA